MEILFKPVGVVRIKATEQEIKTESREVEGVLEIYPEFEPALEGLEGYSHLFVISYFHELRPDQIGPLQVKPKRLVQRGFRLEDLPVLGVFALDSPTRPNPIGLTLVRLVRREGCRLIVSGLDYFDGTPILDIKGYRPEYRTDESTLPEWYLKFMNSQGHI
ncbi:MAG: tRNA (N6-threonylcarbamoyladenosine(37)-N6)-methyltransferase TrmO [Deltaproteobacteria bacterium]|nr:tRNA (N6-threonylcarbamoyladenosine(37)-N6)-methyltransferase TrmO [Deltaproteobacteria bacterium]